MKFMQSHYRGTFSMYFYIIFFGLWYWTKWDIFAYVSFVAMVYMSFNAIMKMIHSYNATRKNGKRKIQEDLDVQAMLKNAR